MDPFTKAPYPSHLALCLQPKTDTLLDRPPLERLRKHVFLGVAEDVITHEGEPTVSFMTSPRVGLQGCGL